MISKSRISIFRPALILRLALALLLIGICPHAVRSQGTEVKIGLQRGNRTRLSLRLDDWIPSGDMGGAMSAAASGLQVLQNDLTISGLFTLSSGAAPKDSLAYATFSEQAEYAVEIRASGNNLELHARLYGLPGRSLISEKTYTGSDVQLRRVVHQMADDVVFQLSGETGIAQTQIAYSLNTAAGREIMMADYDGQNPRQITHDRNLDFSPALSPDGKSLAYSSFRGRGFALCVMDLPSGKDHVLANFPGSALSPAFSPNGQDIAFATSKDGNHEIYVIGRDGTNLRRLTREAGIDVQPSWSPDGRQLAFCSDRAGTAQIYMMDADGTNLHRVTHDKTRNEAPNWSPKGGSLAFMARMGNLYDVCIADVTGGATYNLTQGKGANESPHWAVNGRHLLMISTRDGQPNLYILNTDNGEAFRLPIRGNIETPAWCR